MPKRRLGLAKQVHEIERYLRSLQAELYMNSELLQ
jgi:hypothetical protein